ncbi:MAG: hypothetical protein CVU88_04135 [Firmicutes bacterium HGW-Firmicutes-13]|nr:MAG: hypothetical protein CVU88_04135 [Firmicutes bacterium HGW-Firmicutes-13]
MDLTRPINLAYFILTFQHTAVNGFLEISKDQVYLYLNRNQKRSFLMSKKEEDKIRQAKEKLSTKLMVIKGVVGIGIGKYEDSTCLVVFLEKDVEDLRQKIPQQFEGFKVNVEVTGRIKAWTD